MDLNLQRLCCWGLSVHTEDANKDPVMQQLCRQHNTVLALPVQQMKNQHLNTLTPAHAPQARMHKDIARLEAQRQELADRITSLQASIFKGSEKLDQVSTLHTVVS
jgi:hypothetical protein